MRLDPAEVMAAAADWVFVPEGAPEVRTEEFHLVGFPSYFADPAGVFRISSPRAAADLTDDVVAAMRSLGRSEAVVWVNPLTRPTDLADHLVSLGATVHEELAVLARPLDPLPDLAVPAGFEVRPTTDLDTQRDHERIGVEVFGGQVRSDAELTEAVAQASLEVGVAFVAYRDGRPVATAGSTIVDGVARLWGGAVLAEARGTGAYRALLSHRFAHGLEHGCTMALVKGRLDTSAPILRRAGFVQHGEERGLRLVLA